MKHIAILGSTGSIGKSTLDIIRRHHSDFKAVALSTNSNIDVLYRQIKEFKPLFVCVNDKALAGRLESRLGPRPRVFAGQDGLLRMLEEKRIDKVVLAVSGSAALMPLLKAIDNGKDIALANKESMVMAGPIIMSRASKKKAMIIPIDSEQSAIWQCLDGKDKIRLKNIFLTASGGPFRNITKRQFKNISVRDTLKHPRWKMGQKITVDSASLMNKGLEILESVYLFGVSPDKIKIVIHPEAIIHSMVEYIDGVILAQLSVTDMRIPIQYALSYPGRLYSHLRSVDFYALRQLNFERPDFSKFPCLGLAYRVAEDAGTMPCVLNAANEVSVAEFLKGRLKFVNIPKVIETALSRHKNIKKPLLEDILEADKWAKGESIKIIERIR